MGNNNCYNNNLSYKADVDLSSETVINRNYYDNKNVELIDIIEIPILSNGKIATIKDLDDNIFTKNKDIITKFEIPADIFNILNSLRSSDFYIDITKHSKNICIRRYVNGIYKGEIDDIGNRNGLGIMIYTNNDAYLGKFKNNQRIGPAIFITKKYVYEGYYKNDIKQKRGKIAYFNGITYEGTISNNKKDGYGFLINPDKFNYKGEFKNNKINGKGVITFNNGDIYEGTFKNNLMEGFGNYRFSNGKVYKGSFANGKFNGEGEMIYPNGKIYIGSYKNDKKEGFGKIMYPNKDYYEGNFFNNKKHGNGVFSENNKLKHGIWNKNILIEKIENS